MDDSIDSFKSVDSKIGIFLGFSFLIFINIILFFIEQSVFQKGCFEKVIVVLFLIFWFISLVFLIFSIHPKKIPTKVLFSTDEVFGDKEENIFLQEYFELLNKNTFDIEKEINRKNLFFRLALAFLGFSVIITISLIFL